MAGRENDFLSIYLATPATGKKTNRVTPNTTQAEDDYLSIYLNATGPEQKEPAAAPAAIAKPTKPYENNPSDTTAKKLLKGGATSIVKGLSHIPGVVGDVGNFADYLFARGVSAATGKPLEAVYQEMAQRQAASRENPTAIGQVANALSARNVLPGSEKVQNKIFQYTGEYKPENMVQSIAMAIPEAVISSAAPGMVKGAAGMNPVQSAAKSAPVVAPMAGVGQGVTETTGDPLIGAAASMAVPAAAATKPVSKMISNINPGNAARNQLADDIRLNGEDIPAMQARMANNPRLTLMDVSPSAQRFAMGLANQPGKGSGILREAFDKRTGTSEGANRSAFDKTLGYSPDPVKLENTLVEMTKARAQAGFGQALGNARPVDVTPALAAIDNAIFPGANKLMTPAPGMPLNQSQQQLMAIRAKLTDGNSNLTDPQQLHQIQSEIGRTVRELQKSSNGGDRLMANELAKVRGALVEQIDVASGGKYKPAQKQFADDISVREAYHEGMDIFRNARGKASLETRPEALREAMKSMTPDELNAFRQGARVAVDNELGMVRNAARKGEAINEIPFNREKLELVMGKQEANKLTRLLQDESQIAKTNAMLYSGSQTHPRMMAQQATKVREANFSPYGQLAALPVVGEAAAALGYLPQGVPALVGMSAGAVGYGINRGLRYYDMAKNAELARLITTPGAAMPGMGMQGGTPPNRLYALPLTYVTNQATQGR